MAYATISEVVLSSEVISPYCLLRGLWLDSRYKSLSACSMAPAMSSKELKDAYDKNSTAVFRLAYSLLRDHAAAEDLTHDVFLRFWKSDKYDSQRGSKLTYLLTLARSMALNRIEQIKNRKNILYKWKTMFKQSTSENSHQGLEENETSTAIQLALASLSESQRQVLELCYIQGKSHQETSLALRIPLGTVKTHARRGLIALKAELDLGKEKTHEL